MKKGIIICLAIIVLPFLGCAQNWLTLKGGAGVAFFNGSQTINSGLAINSGIGYKHQLTKYLVVEADVLLDTRSNGVPLGTVDANGNENIYNTSATYIQIPLTAHYNWLLQRNELVPYRTYDSKSFLYVEGGPFFAYGLDVNHYVDSTIVTMLENTDSPISEANLEANTIDAGVTVGFGINQTYENSNKLNFGVRFNYGFLDIYKDARLGSANNLALVGHISLDLSLTKRKHVRHRW